MGFLGTGRPERGVFGPRVENEGKGVFFGVYGDVWGVFYVCGGNWFRYWVGLVGVMGAGRGRNR